MKDTDLELLELAAKAAGIEVQRAAAGKCPMCGEAHTLSQCPRWRQRGYQDSNARAAA